MTNARIHAVVDDSSSATESSRQNPKRQVATQHWADSAKGKCILMSSLSRNTVWAVSPQAQLLLRILIDYAGPPKDEEGNAVFTVKPHHSPTLAEIAERNPGLNKAKPTTVRTVQRWLRELKEAGMVEAMQTRLGNGYRITLPMRAIEGETTGARAHSVQEHDERDGCNVETEHHDGGTAVADEFIENMAAVPRDDSEKAKSLLATLKGKRLDRMNADRVRACIKERLRTVNPDITDEEEIAGVGRVMQHVTIVADKEEAIAAMSRLGVDPMAQASTLRSYTPDDIVRVASYVREKRNISNPAGLFLTTMRRGGNFDWINASRRSAERSRATW